MQQNVLQGALSIEHCGIALGEGAVHAVTTDSAHTGLTASEADVATLEGTPAHAQAMAARQVQPQLVLTSEQCPRTSLSRLCRLPDLISSIDADVACVQPHGNVLGEQS